jgi:type II secretory pathway component PulJ
MRNNRGFTLLEGLFSMFIVLLVLGGLSNVLSQAASMKKNTKDMDQAIEIYHALFSIRKDILAAIAISQPAEGTTGTTLRLNRVNPRLSYLDRTDTLTDPLDPFEAAEQVEVEYRLDAEVLKRFETVPSEAPTAERLIPIQEVTFSRTGGRSPTLTVVLTVDRNRVTKTHSIKVTVNVL